MKHKEQLYTLCRMLLTIVIYNARLLDYEERQKEPLDALYPLLTHAEGPTHEDDVLLSWARGGIVVE